MEEGQTTQSECWARKDDAHSLPKQGGGLCFSAVFDSLMLSYPTHASVKCELRCLFCRASRHSGKHFLVHDFN